MNSLVSAESWGTEQWLRPREAVRLLMERCHLPREVSISTLASRIWSASVVSTVGRVAGHTVAGSSLLPAFLPQIMPAALWDHDLFCSPDSPLWLTGDLQAYVPAGPIRFYNIRLNPSDVERVIDDVGGVPSQLAVSPPPAAADAPLDPVRMAISRRSEPKWDWDGAFAALVALADKDGLNTIDGYDSPERRGAEAKIAQWFGAYFSSYSADGDEPADSELRRRAKLIISALRQ